MSSISNKFEDARAALSELSRKRKFKKANAARSEAAELQSELAKCRGKLEICKKDFQRTVKHQVAGISEGISIGADTSIQEQTLWDAAIGYMIVKDAIFSMKSIATFDSVAHAYEMLDAAVDQITTRQRTLPKLPKIGGRRGRNVYGYITSNAALKQKEELLDGFFDELKQTGDIEGCLATARHPAELRADRVADAKPFTHDDLWADVPDANDTSDSDIDDTSLMDGMMDIHPPIG